LGTTYDTGGKNPGSADEISRETTCGQASDAAACPMANNTTIFSHRERRELSGAVEIPSYLVTMIAWIQAAVA